MRFSIVTGAFPPALDGIGDYTALLANELAGAHQVAVITGTSNPDTSQTYGVSCGFDSTKIRSTLSLVQHVKRFGPDWLSIQYCPFSYGRYGWNPFLPLALTRLSRAAPELRIALTVHEAMAWPVNWKLRTMNLWQGPLLRILTGLSTVSFVVVGKWRTVYRRWLRSDRVVHLPVGSNIPATGNSVSNARKSLGISDDVLVLGVFGQGHHSHDWSKVATAARSIVAKGYDLLLLHMGSGSDRAHSEFQGLPNRVTGRLSAARLSECLMASDVFVAPFVDGVSTRRGTLMAALQHALPVVGTHGDATDEVLSDADGKALLLVPCDDQDAFTDTVLRLIADAQLRARLGDGARRLYEARFSWPVIARTMVETLQDTPPYRSGGRSI